MRGTTLTVRGIVVLAAGIGALLAAATLEIRELLFVGLVLLALPLATAVVLSAARPSIAVHRGFEPRLVELGETARVEVDVRNVGRSSSPAFTASDELRVRVIGDDAGGRSAGSASSDRSLGTPGRFEVPALAAAGQRGSRVGRGYEVTGAERGVHRLGPLRIERHDLFGLVRRREAVGEPQAFVVTPRVETLDVDVLEAVGSGGGSPSSRPVSGAGADDVIPREYRAGDPMRRVHWRATARTGELKVRQDEQNTDPHAWLLLDTRLDRYETLDADRADAATRFEWAVSMAASVVHHLVEIGIEPHLIETAEQTGATLDQAETGGTAGHDELEAVHEILVHLAEVALVSGAATLVDDAPQRLVAEVREHGGSRPVIAVLGAVDGRDVDRLEAVAPLGRPAIVFLVGATDAAADAMRRAGWYVVEVDGLGDPGSTGDPGSAASSGAADDGGTGSRAGSGIAPGGQAEAWAAGLAQRRLV